MKKWIIISLSGLLLLLAAGFGAYRWYQDTYIQIGDVVYRRDITELDLSGSPIAELEKLPELQNLQRLDLQNTGLTTQEYETLRAALPDCTILWSPPFQGDYCDENTTSVTITTLTEADIAALEYLPMLESVDARGCQDYALLTALREQRPDLEVRYYIALSGQEYSWDTARIALETADPEELMERLQYFPNLVSLVIITPDEGDIAWLLDVCGAYPDVTIDFDFTLYGVEIRSQDTQVDLSGIEIDDLDLVESITSRMPNIQKVIMSDCGIDNETMDALNRRYDDIQYVWTVVIGNKHSLRTDETAYIPVKTGYVVFNDSQLYNLRYCTELVALDLGHHAMTNVDFVQYMPHLRYLIIADSVVSDLTPLSGLKELVYLELFGTQVTDYSPLLGCTALEDLNICYTHGDPEIIAQMTSLKRVWWINPSYWRCTAEEQAMLAEALPECYLIYNGTSSTGSGWRQGSLYYEMRDYLGMYYMTG